MKMIDSHSNLSVKRLEILGHHLKRLTLLQDLYLDFGWCRKIEDEGLQKLTEGFCSSLFRTVEINYCG